MVPWTDNYNIVQLLVCISQYTVRSPASTENDKPLSCSVTTSRGAKPPDWLTTKSICQHLNSICCNMISNFTFCNTFVLLVPGHDAMNNGFIMQQNELMMMKCKLPKHHNCLYKVLTMTQCIY